MAKNNNVELIGASALRFLRAAGATVLGMLVPWLVDLLPQLELSPEIKVVLSGLVIPGLLALDKYLRGRGFY